MYSYIPEGGWYSNPVGPWQVCPKMGPICYYSSMAEDGVRAVIGPVIEPQMRAHANIWKANTDPEVIGWNNNAVGTGFCGVISDGMASRPPPVSRSWSLVSPTKGPGTMREWTESHTNGKILVRPRTILAASVMVTPYMTGVSANVLELERPISLQKIGGLRAGRSVPCARTTIDCEEGFAGMTSASYNPSTIVTQRMYQKRYYHTGWASVPVAEVSAITDAMTTQFGLVEPDLTLVTQKVSEANEAVIDYLTALAEFPETLAEIFAAIKFILAKYLELRGKVKELQKKKVFIGQEVADLWLWFRYSVTPNVLTINAALAALEADFVEYQSFRGSTDRLIELSAGPWSCEYTSVGHFFLKRRYSIEGWETSDSVWGSFLPTTIWELTRASFLVDWAFGVGDFLSSLSTPETVMQEAATWADRTNETVIWQAATRPGAAVTVNWNGYNRSPIDPSAYCAPTWRLELSSKRILDAFALSWGVTSKSFKRALRRLTHG